MKFYRDDVYQLIKRIESVRDCFADDKTDILRIYSSVNPKHDARITAYSKAINVLNSVQLAFTFILKHLLNNQWWEAISNKSLSISDRRIYAKEFANFTKIAFIQGLFLSIESSLRLFLRALDSSACNGGMSEFKSIYECLFRSKLSETPAEGIPLLDLFRLVRNTIHNNGVYFHLNGNDASVTWKGKTYEFKQGYAIDFVTWDFLIELSEALQVLLREVVEDTNLKRVTLEIKDPFSQMNIS